MRQYKNLQIIFQQLLTFSRQEIKKTINMNFIRHIFKYGL